MQQTFSYIQQELRGLYADSELKSIAFLLIEKLTGMSRTQVLINKGTIFSDEERKQITAFVEKLKKGVPVQYVLGEAEFYGLRFAVDESVLIPRPETEELVEWMASDYQNAPGGRLLDIGVGSGCISIALKSQLPGWQVEAWDISADALAVAEGNAKRNGTDVSFCRRDILNDEPEGEWEVIVSNPPYIPEREKVRMSANVLEYEPASALFVPDEKPLLFYEKIAGFAQTHLTKGGSLYFEIHFDAGRRIVELLEKKNFRCVELRQDMAGNDRMVKAVL